MPTFDLPGRPCPFAARGLPAHGARVPVPCSRRIMARRTNYNFEKRQREKKKARKKEIKREQKQERKDGSEIEETPASPYGDPEIAPIDPADLGLDH
jgi:hypothetical protein